MPGGLRLGLFLLVAGALAGAEIALDPEAVPRSPGAGSVQPRRREAQLSAPAPPPHSCAHDAVLRDAHAVVEARGGAEELSVPGAQAYNYHTADEGHARRCVGRARARHATRQRTPRLSSRRLTTNSAAGIASSVQPPPTLTPNNDEQITGEQLGPDPHPRRLRGRGRCGPRSEHGRCALYLPPNPARPRGHPSVRSRGEPSGGKDG